MVWAKKLILHEPPSSEFFAFVAAFFSFFGSAFVNDCSLSNSVVVRDRDGGGEGRVEKM